MCGLILENTNNTHIKNQFGSTPIHIAAYTGNLAFCKLIYNYSKDVSPKCDKGRTPLHEAVEKG